MTYEVTVQTLSPRIIAAVRRRVPIKDISTAFKPALDTVWSFLRNHHGLRTDGHNIFLYHHENPSIMPVDFGVEVTRRFDGEGDVRVRDHAVGRGSSCRTPRTLCEAWCGAPGIASMVWCKWADHRSV